VVGLGWSHDPESYTGGSLLLVGSPMPDRSKVMTQTKRETPALQVWGNGSREELPLGIVLSRGVAPPPLRATSPPGPGGSTCQGPRPQGYEGARWVSIAKVMATRLGEKTLNKSWPSRLGVCREACSLTQENLNAKKTQRGIAGQMTLRRPRHVKRMKSESIEIGTWNVNTMLKASKMQEIADQITGSQIQIVALQ